MYKPYPTYKGFLLCEPSINSEDEPLNHTHFPTYLKPFIKDFQFIPCEPSVLHTGSEDGSPTGVLEVLPHLQQGSTPHGVNGDVGDDAEGFVGEFD